MQTTQETTNRVEAFAEKLRESIASGQKLDGSGPIGDIEELDAGMSLSITEAAAYQDTQAWAFMRGILTKDEALTVWRAIGDPTDPDGTLPDPANGGWSTRTDVALKVAVTRVMAELYPARLRDR